VFACDAFPWWVSALYFGFRPLAAGLALIGGWKATCLWRSGRPALGVLIVVLALGLIAMLAALRRLWFA
jgi:hypothetical protein